LNGLANQIKEGAQNREVALQDALEVAEKFHDLCGDTMSNLRDLKDNMISQEPPGVDPQTVKEQQKELKVILFQCFLFFISPTNEVWGQYIGVVGPSLGLFNGFRRITRV
jgi:hypothetical protein